MIEKVKEKDVYFFRYRLNENAKYDTASIEGIHLSKKWLEVQREIPALKNWVRSFSNPDGVVDKDVFEIHSNKSLLLDRRIYTADELMALRRDQIVPICDSWDIRHSSIKKDKLIEILCAKFEEQKKATANRKNIMPGDNIVPSSEEVNEPIVNQQPIEISEASADVSDLSDLLDERLS